MRLPPVTDNEELNRWLFEAYSEINANIYKEEVIIESPNGTRYRLIVDNDGNLTTEAV